MTLFLKNAFYFIAIPIIIGLVILLSFTEYTNALKINYKINPEISTVFIGDSHIKLAVIDSLIPRSLNIAEKTESYYFTYYKLKMLLDNNPSIKQVYLGLSYHNLSKYYDRFISGDFSWAITPNYFYLLPRQEQFKTLVWNKNNLMLFTKIVNIRRKEKAKNKNYSPFTSSFENEFNKTEALKVSMDKRLQLQYFDNNEEQPFSELNIEYLSKIINLCETNDVKITALNTPLNNYFHSKTPKIYKEKLKVLLAENQLDYIDFSNLNFSNNFFIPDGDHVSYEGAEVISFELKKLSIITNKTK